MWFAKWCDIGPLQNRIWNRDIVFAGFNLKDKVIDCLDSQGWKRPLWWLDKYPFLNTIEKPNLIEQRKTCYIV